MKNVMKKVFSLLLVGVVAVSMFGFIAPTHAEASEENTNGTVELSNSLDRNANFILCFHNDEEELVEAFSVVLLSGQDRSFSVPINTKFVRILIEDGVSSFDLDFNVNEDNISVIDFAFINLINDDGSQEHSVVSYYTSGFSRIK